MTHAELAACQQRLLRMPPTLPKRATRERKCRKSPAYLGDIPVFGRLSAETFFDPCLAEAAVGLHLEDQKDFTVRLAASRLLRSVPAYKLRKKSIMAALTSGARSCSVQWPQPGSMIAGRSLGTIADCSAMDWE
jgi:hypothetical protein